jgi:hypothetical protein
MNELDEIELRVFEQGLNEPNSYKAHLVGCSDRLLEIEKEYLTTQLRRCEPSREKYFAAKIEILEAIQSRRKAVQA